ncbi:MAG: hypothetical protein ACI8QT_000878 [Halioglobus sp.]
MIQFGGSALLETMQCDAMKEIAQHRAAGLAGQLNIETVDAVGLLLTKTGA